MQYNDTYNEILHYQKKRYQTVSFLDAGTIKDTHFVSVVCIFYLEM